MRTVFILMLFFSFPAGAETYKCIEDGKTLLTDAPCQNKGRPQARKTEDKTAAQLQAEFEKEVADKKAKEKQRLEEETQKILDNEKQFLAEAACQRMKKQPGVVYNSPFNGSVEQVESYIKTRLRDPVSFQAAHWESVSRRCDGSYIVSVTYRARNGFGGMNVVKQLFELDENGVIFKEYTLK